MWRETLTFCEAFLCSYSANGNSGQIKQNKNKTKFFFQLVTRHDTIKKKSRYIGDCCYGRDKYLSRLACIPKATYIFMVWSWQLFYQDQLVSQKAAVMVVLWSRQLFFSRLAWIPNITYIIQILYFSRPAFSPKAT